MVYSCSGKISLAGCCMLCFTCVQFFENFTWKKAFGITVLSQGRVGNVTLPGERKWPQQKNNGPCSGLMRNVWEVEHIYSFLYVYIYIYVYFCICIYYLLLLKVSGTKNAGTEPYKASLGWEFPYISRIHTAYITVRIPPF